MPITAPVIDAKDLIQINATMLAGILIFYTIPYITRGRKTAKTIVYVRGPEKVEKKYKSVTENVLTLIAKQHFQINRGNGVTSIRSTSSSPQLNTLKAQLSGRLRLSRVN